MKQLTIAQIEEKNVVRLDEIKDFINQEPFICEYVGKADGHNCKKTATHMVNKDVSFWCDEHVLKMDESI